MSDNNVSGSDSENQGENVPIEVESIGEHHPLFDVVFPVAAQYIDSSNPDSPRTAIEAARALWWDFQLREYEADQLMEAFCVHSQSKLTEKERELNPGVFLIRAKELPEEPGKPRGWRVKYAIDQAEMGRRALRAMDLEKAMKGTQYPRFSNLGGDNPRKMGEIDQALNEILPGKFERSGDQLFVESDEHRPIYLKKHAQLFAYIGDFAQVVWKEGFGCVSRDEYFEHLKMISPNRETIEYHPHHPPMKGVRYMHPPLPESTGKLDEFIAMFNPATEIDRDLIKSYVLTLAWGGQPGNRPLFMATGLEDDPKRGRGIGKSILFQIIANEVFEGFFDIEAICSMEAVKKRLLSKDAGGKRACGIDNVKSLKFSWAELEAMVTAERISGHRMYIGEGSRPNTLTWHITFNGPSLSTDLSQRTITIVLERPDNNGGWEAETRRFAQEHRWEIIAECVALLASERDKVETKTRWGNWESSVLSRATEKFEECQALIVERQSGVDCDEDESLEVREYFIQKLTERKHKPEQDCIRIPSMILAQWLSEVKQHHFRTEHATTTIKNMAIEELTQFRTKKLRGFVWSGKGEGAKSDSEPITLNDLPFGLFPSGGSSFKIGGRPI